MAFMRDQRLLERLLMAVLLFAFASFAYYFSVAEIEERQNRYNNSRITSVKLLARELTDLLDKRMSLSPKLENLLALENVAYAVVHQADGAVVARAKNPSLPVGIFNTFEEQALKTGHLTINSFLDTSGTIAVSEAAMPLISSGNKKYVLRVGFYRNHEERDINNIRFRNLLGFSFIVLALFAYWFIKIHRASTLQHSLLGGTAMVILILFLGTRITLQSWYDKHWRESFVRHSLYLTKVFSPSAVRFLETGEEKDLQAAVDLIAHDEDFSYIAVIRDERVVFHSDPSKLGNSLADDPDYLHCLNQDEPQIIKVDEQDLYETFVPLMSGNHRLGTLKAGMHNISGYAPLNILRDRIIMLFVFALFLLLFYQHLLARRVSKEISGFINAMERVTGGDLGQNVHIERNDEFGQLAHAFNFMIMSMKDRDLIGRGLQQYVSKSIVERTLKALSGHEKNGERLFAASLFLYFSGIDEAIAKVEGARIFSAVQECFNLLGKISNPGSNANIQLFPSGILVLFTFSNKHDSLLKALNVARIAAKDLGRRPDMPFAPKITLHAIEMIRGKINDSAHNSSFIGEGFADFRALSKVQDADEIIASREVHVLLKDVVNFAELEVLSGEQGKFNAFVLRNFKEQDELTENFEQATSWTKIMILRVLKASGDFACPQLLCEWFKSDDPEVRFHVLDALEKLKPEQLCDFVVEVIKKEKEPKVLSLAIRLLGKIGKEEHVSLLTEKLRSTDRRVKANTVEALEAIGGKRVYEYLNLLLDEQDNRVKANILIALGKYGDLKVFDLLSHMIKDSEPHMRASAAFALGRLGMAQGVEPLVNALNDKDPMVRRQVVASLTTLKADLDIDI